MFFGGAKLHVRIPVRLIHAIDNARGRAKPHLRLAGNVRIRCGRSVESVEHENYIVRRPIWQMGSDGVLDPHNVVESGGVSRSAHPVAPIANGD